MENGILTPEEINIGNRLIARFDGYVQKPDSYMWYNINDDKDFRTMYDFQYDNDPIGIMYILEKISVMTINGYTPYFEITNFGCQIDLTKISNDLKFRGSHGATLMTNIWIMIVEFLDWYLNKYLTNNILVSK